MCVCVCVLARDYFHKKERRRRKREARGFKLVQSKPVYFDTTEAPVPYKPYDFCGC